MLVVLMYHRICYTHPQFMDEQNASAAFYKHLAYLAKHHPIVVPGDKLVKHRVNVCLSFDDAYFDFYHTVFPLLKQLQLKALLAIPSGLILDTTVTSLEKRLQVPYRDAMAANKTHGTLCTWEEIRTMLGEECVIPAAHGFQHLAINPDNMEQEVIFAKKHLEKQTGREINTFVYPYGQMNRDAHALVKQEFPYSMRIGSSANFSWNNFHKVIYRINADEFWTKSKPMFSMGHQLTLNARLLSNSLRFK